MVIESYLQYDKSIEWSKFFQAKFPTLFSTFQCSLENPALSIACFPFYSFPFSFETLYISFDPTTVMIAQLTSWSFQISEAEPNETPYVML